jgi:hypothetical protein
MRYDTWTDQEHDKNSNVVDYQADSPQPFVVELRVLPTIRIPNESAFDHANCHIGLAVKMAEELENTHVLENKINNN